MRECRQVDGALQDYLDGMLGPAAAAAVQEHLTACPDCLATETLQREVRARLVEEIPPRPVPRSLRKAVEAICRPVIVRRAPVLFRRIALAAASLLLLLGGLGLVWQLRPSTPPPLVAEAIDDHLRFRLRNNPVDLPSADPRQIRQWLAAHTVVPFDPPQGESAGLMLLGGGLTYLMDQKVACVLYRRDKTLFTLFVLQEGTADLPRGLWRKPGGLYAARDRGYGVILWRQDRLVYALVSDLPEAELSTIATSMLQI
ncbi:MAG: anti-sigma factor family protein [Candidatus Methylomirabilales bacterium]